jgi:hypothetical protein
MGFFQALQLRKVALANIAVAELISDFAQKHLLINLRI